MNNKNLLIIIGTILLFTTLIYQQKILPKSKQNTKVEEPQIEWLTKKFEDIQFKYPDNFVPTPITKDQETLGMFFRAANREALISIRKETKLGVLKLTGNNILDTLVKNAERRYPEQFPDYKKIAYQEKIIANEKAAALDFTYKGKDHSITMRQRLIIIVVKDNIGYLFSFQTEKNKFTDLEPYFDKIMDSVKFF